MNNIKKYIKNIWTIMPMHTKKEKFYLNELKKHLNEYLDEDRKSTRLNSSHL